MPPPGRLPYETSTPRVYPRGGADRPVVWSETVVSPGATFLRVHFSKLSLPDGDYVTVASPDGEDFWTLAATYAPNDTWAFRLGGGKHTTFFGNIYWKTDW